MIRIEFLYFNGCPGHEPAWELLSEVLAESKVEVEIERIEIPNADKVEAHRFLGSPSIRINGEDLEGSEVENEIGYGWRCRFYEDSEPGQPKAVPNRRLIWKRLQKALVS